MHGIGRVVNAYQLDVVFVGAVLFSLCCVDTFTLYNACGTMFISSLSLSIVCVVFHALYVVCWSFVMGSGLSLKYNKVK